MNTDEFRIDDLITKLQAIRAEHGNLIVGLRRLGEISEDGYCEEYFDRAETAVVRTETNDGQVGWIDDRPETILRKVVIVGTY